MMSTAQTLEVPGYQVVQFLGSGARSTIWQVRDRRTGQMCALKRVVRQQGSDARFFEQTLNEYAVSSHFSHPVIRRIYRLRRVRRWLALKEIQLIMELCEGRTVQESRPADVRETARIFGHVGKALAHMNACGYVHADMKPNNIVVAPDSGVKIIDLGQSCPIGTVKRRIQGTPDFIAPEQVHRQPLDGRTDVFNFGAAFYWALSGRAIPTALPKKGATVLVAELAVTPVEKLNPEVPTPLSKLITDCIEVRPTRRPESMAAVVARLELVAHALNEDQ